MNIVTSELITEQFEETNITVDENELDRIQNTFIEDIEIEFAECEIFPQPFFHNRCIKTEGNADNSKENSAGTILSHIGVINPNPIETADTCNTLNQSCSFKHPLFGNLIFEMGEVRYFFPKCAISA